MGDIFLLCCKTFKSGNIEISAAFIRGNTVLQLSFFRCVPVCAERPNGDLEKVRHASDVAVKWAPGEVAPVICIQTDCLKLL